MAVGRHRFRLAGVMGWPIAHSRSPKIHNHWFSMHGIDGVYAPLAIEPGRLDAALRALPALNFSGCNLTIPHKEAALAIVDRLDRDAERIGAVNCVVVEENGGLIGKNYDAFGFMASLRAEAPNWRRDSPAVVIGAGGAARAVVCALIDAGVPEIRICNRTIERAQALAASFGAPVRAVDFASREGQLADAGLLVNASSLGMIGQPPLDLPLTALSKQAVVCDIVYAPLTTPLLERARALGLTTVDGLGMLLHQARPAFRDWFGVMPEVTPALRQLIAGTL